MRLLVDTHAALWWLADDDRLGEDAAARLAEPTNEVLLSAAVVWEVAIKRALEKLVAPPDFAKILLGAGARPLPVGIDHAAAVSGLPPHHRDPFDRLLVAQARIEDAVLVSRAPILRSYDVQVTW